MAPYVRPPPTNTNKRLRLLKPSPSPEPTLAIEPVWHSFHVDPNHNIVLKSQDGVHFRASSYALQRESGFFKDMFDTLPSKYMSVHEAITLDFSAEAITAFLDMYSIPGTVRGPFPATGFDTLLQISRLFKFLDCHRLLPLVDAAFSYACAGEPVKWLLLASANNDLDSAEKALGKCRHSKDVDKDVKGVFALVEKIREEWRYPLLLCLTSTQPYITSYHGSRNNGDLTVNWPDDDGVKRFRECILLVGGGGTGLDDGSQ